MCENLSAKSCRSCGQWSWVCVKIFPLSHVDDVVAGHGYISAKSCRSCGRCVKIFPLSHVDRVVNGPGYV